MKRLLTVPTLILGAAGAFGTDLTSPDVWPPEMGNSLTVPSLPTTPTSPSSPSFSPNSNFPTRPRRSDTGTTSNSTLPLPPATPPLAPPSPAPTPMDLSISYSLSKPCLLYLTSVLSSPTFKSCLPLSLLLTTSTSYSELLSETTTPPTSNSNYTTLNSLLAYTNNPQPSPEQCSSYMQTVQSNLKDKANCASDLKAGKAVVEEMEVGVGNYEVVRQMGGLRDPDEGWFCYLEAVEKEEPDDLYLWSLPAGMPLPASSIPTCSKCSALVLNTLAMASASGETTMLNATIIEGAVERVNEKCGPAFANYHARASSGVGVKIEGLGRGWWGILGLSVGVGLGLLW